MAHEEISMAGTILSQRIFQCKCLVCGREWHIETHQLINAEGVRGRDGQERLGVNCRGLCDSPSCLSREAIVQAYAAAHRQTS